MISVAFDARKYSDYGIGTYIRYLLGGMARLPSAPRLTLFTTRGVAGLDPYPKSWIRKEVPFKSYSVGEYFLLGGEIRKAGCNLFHAPHYTIPARPGIPTIVTIHDLIHLRFPTIFSPLKRAYARFMLGHAVKVASLVLTPSEATKRDLTTFLGADPSKIRVTPLGVGEAFRQHSEGELLGIRTKYSLPRTYILFLGNPKPHKGISTLLHAIERIHRRNKDLQLIIAGGTEEDARTIRSDSEALGIGDVVRPIHGLPQVDISLIIGAARLLAMPSLWEGFGLPVLESMACGTPVVCSTAGSLPEVVGNAAFMFEPGDVDALSQNILSIASDDILHHEYRDRGIIRSKLYRWDDTVEQTLEAYRTVAR